MEPDLSLPTPLLVSAGNSTMSKQTNTFSSSSSSRCPIVRKRCRTNSGDESSEDCFELTQSSSPSRVKNAVKRFSHKKTDRRTCPHCNELLSLKTYKTHKRLFYDEVRLYVNSGNAIITDVLNRIQPSVFKRRQK